MGINCAAIDLGASSGRLMLGEYDGEKIKLSEVYRFTNEPVKLRGTLYWNTFGLFREIKEGLKKISAMGQKIASVGIDTWGVDYGLLDKDDNIIGFPIHYRDVRTAGITERAAKKMPLDSIYSITGIQFMDFNTIFQLFADNFTRPAVLQNADKFLMMPDLMNFLLSGVKLNEYTNLSTTQALDARNKKIDAGLLKNLGIPEKIFCETVEPGNVIGGFSNDIGEETGLKNIKVVAVGSHDTASAVCGTPLTGGDSAYISCGTWSLLGIETPEPIINGDSYKYNFTNEGGVENTIRFLKNINGLWIIQQLRKSYNENNNASLGFAEIVSAAENAKNKDLKIDPSDPSFTAPPDMTKAIVDHLKKSGLKTPDGLGEIAASVYNGITDEYASHVANLEKITGKKINKINMIGGGIKDEYLCKLSAVKTGKIIEAGPVEASVLGNIVMQLKAIGEINGMKQGREIISRSFARKVYEPDAVK